MFQAPFRDDNGQAQTILNYVPWIIIKIQEGRNKQVEDGDDEKKEK